MLHPRVGEDDQVAGKPGADKHHQRGDPVEARAQTLFAEEEQAEERGFQEKGKHAFHGEGLADHAAGGFRELRPVCAELKFHRDAGDHAEGKADAEDFGPETRGVVPAFVAGAQSDGLQDEDQQGKSYGELRENVMEGDGECEEEAMNGYCVFHGTSFRARNAKVEIAETLRVLPWKRKTKV